MKELKNFAFGALKMLVMMALVIVCINAIVAPHNFIKAVGVISLTAVLWEVYLLFKNTRNN